MVSDATIEYERYRMVTEVRRRKRAEIVTMSSKKHSDRNETSLAIVRVNTALYLSLPPSSSVTHLQANPSASLSGGGRVTRSGRSIRHVTRVGALAALGGTRMRSPVCRLPRIEPPRASTKKETRNLCSGGGGVGKSG